MTKKLIFMDRPQPDETDEEFADRVLAKMEENGVVFAKDGQPARFPGQPSE